MTALITPETMRAHRAIWWVWGWNSSTGERAKLRHTSKMRGIWGWDVTCSCGQFETRTGDATRGSVQRELDDHRYEAQSAKERAANGRRVTAAAGHRAGQSGVETFPAAESGSAYSLVLWDDGEEECCLANYLSPANGETKDAQ